MISFQGNTASPSKKEEKLPKAAVKKMPLHVSPHHRTSSKLPFACDSFFPSVFVFLKRTTSIIFYAHFCFHLLFALFTVSLSSLFAVAPTSLRWHQHQHVRGSLTCAVGPDAVDHHSGASSRFA